MQASALILQLNKIINNAGFTLRLLSSSDGSPYDPIPRLSFLTMKLGTRTSLYHHYTTAARVTRMTSSMRPPLVAYSNGAVSVRIPQQPYSSLA